MDSSVTRLGGFHGGAPRGVGAGTGHLLVEALIPSRRLPRLWKHSGTGCVLSWTPRSGTHIQPQCDGDGTTRSGALGSGCRTSAGKVDATLPNFYLELAERVGFEPTCPLLAGKTLSRRPRYDRFGTSPRKIGFRQETRVIGLEVSSAVSRIPYPFLRPAMYFLRLRKNS